MGTIVNPIYANLYSGAVPGMSLPPTTPGASGSTGSNPVLPSTNLSPSGGVSSNPYGTSAPAFPANTGGGYASTNLAAPGGGGSVPGALPGTPGGPQNTTQMAQSSPFSFLTSMSPTDISRLFNSLKSTYGDGMAHMILDFMTSGAGFNQQAVNNLFASMQPGIERGTESLMNQFSVLGNRFGSGAQTGLGDYLSQVNLNMGQLETQMYEQSIQDFMNVLMGTGSTVAQSKAASPSILDTIGSAIGLGGQAAGAVSQGFGIGGTAGSVLDAIAGISL